MAGRITIDRQRCKGCNLCVVACPHNCIEIDEQSNRSGYFPACATNVGCTGCGVCAIVCPDAAIEVLREDRMAAVENTAERKADWVRK